MQSSKDAYPGMRICFWTIFFVVLIAELIAAYVWVYQHDYIFGDAISRTANAYYVIGIVPSKLASIGFVWNPLPSFLQLPLLYLRDYWRPLVTSGMAGCIVTSIFAAVNASMLFKYFYVEGSRIWFALVIALAYAFNPFIFLYGFNGMSETLFFTAVIVGTHNFAMWMLDRNSNRLLLVAVMLAMAFLTRYETFAWMMGIATSLLVVVYMMEDRQSPFKPKPLKMKLNYLTATGSVLFVPVVYTIFIWMFLCLTIMGDPFFFFWSAYSNEAQSISDVEIQRKSGEFIELFFFTLKSALPFLPPFLVILVERTATKRLFRADMLVLVLLAGSFVGFHYMLMLRGRSFGWLRFFSYILPVAVAWLPYELGRLKKTAKMWTSIGLCVAMIVVSPLLVRYYFAYETLGGEEFRAMGGRPDVNHEGQKIIADIINKKYADKKIMFDSFVASIIIMNLDHPENLITTTSDEFDKAVKNPVGYGVDYIVTVHNQGVGLLDAFNREYPDIFEKGAPWAEFVEGTDFFRIYKVLKW